MNGSDAIPKDILDASEEIMMLWFNLDRHSGATRTVARAILAERNRCLSKCESMQCASAIADGEK